MIGMYLAFAFQKKGESPNLYKNPYRAPRKLREDEIIYVK